jgi:hypothetical protein
VLAWRTKIFSDPAGYSQARRLLTDICACWCGGYCCSWRW